VIDEITEKRDELVLSLMKCMPLSEPGQGGGEGGLDIANTFKPAMARGEKSRGREDHDSTNRAAQKKTAKKAAGKRKESKRKEKSNHPW